MIYHIFTQALQRSPNSIAIVTSSGVSLTYTMANQRVNQWVNYFLELRIEEGARVGVLLEDEDHYVFIHLALDRINAIYVPFDADIPRLQLPIDAQTAGLNKLLIDERFLTQHTLNLKNAVESTTSGYCTDSLSDFDDFLLHRMGDTISAKNRQNRLKNQHINHHRYDSTAFFRLNEEALLPISVATVARIYSGSDAQPAVQYDMDGFKKISYIVSSSGSTGDKKWIPINGAGLLYWADLEKKRNQVYPAKKILSTRSPGYDARIYEYVVSFASEGTLYLLSYAQRKDLDSIVALCEQESINKMLLIASQLSRGNTEQLLQRLKNAGLSDLLVTGDACSPHLKSICETQAINLWNAYGPTEATFGLSILRVNDLPLSYIDGQATVPIGKPEGEGVACYLIDKKLYIDSIYMTPGYVVEAQNDQAFLAHEVSPGQERRLFATGDYFTADETSNLLYFQGRENFCKPGGVKVTVPYIEQCLNDYKLLSNDTILEVAVVIKPYLKEERPFAYLVLRPEFDLEAFKEYLEQRLEKEKRPVVIQLDALPILPTSGKINVRELVTRDDRPEQFLFYSSDKNNKETEYTAAVQAIRRVWSDVFSGLPADFSNDLDFSDLAGTSLQLIDLCSKIHSLYEHYHYEQLWKLERISVNTIANSLHRVETPSLHPELLIKEQALIYKLGVHIEGRASLFIPPDLLGRTHTSYQNLAHYLSKFDYNIYVLSDPGIANSDLLPKSLDHAVTRYYNAIKSIEPCGTYRLLGFSFGATLVYLLAERFEADYDRVAEIHLIDGYPPCFYQLLSDEEYFKSLVTLVNFLVPLFNNSYYGEALDPVQGEQESSLHLSKPKQIELILNDLKQKLKNPRSLATLNMVQCHLHFLLTAKTPKEPLRCSATLYLTNTKQDYHQVFNELPLAKTSADRSYYFWGRYFYSLTRCGVELDGNHLSVLGAVKAQQTPEAYITRANDSVYNMEFADYGLGSFYTLVPIDAKTESDYCFSVFFIKRKNHLNSIANDLARMGLFPCCTHYDSNLQKTHDGKDTLYGAEHALFCHVPRDKHEELQVLIKKSWWWRIYKIKPWRHGNDVSPPSLLKPNAISIIGTLDFLVSSGNTPLLTLSFSYYLPTVDLLDRLGSLLKAPSCLRVCDEDKNRLIYEHKANVFIGNTFNMLAAEQAFMIDFMLTIAPYIIQACPSLEFLNAKEQAERTFKAMTTNAVEVFLQELALGVAKKSSSEFSELLHYFYGKDRFDFDNHHYYLYEHQFLEMIWDKVSESVIQEFFAQYGHLYENDKSSREFLTLINHWHGLNWPVVTPLMDNCIEKEHLRAFKQTGLTALLNRRHGLFSASSAAVSENHAPSLCLIR